MAHDRRDAIQRMLLCAARRYEEECGVGFENSVLDPEDLDSMDEDELRRLYESLPEEVRRRDQAERSRFYIAFCLGLAGWKIDDERPGRVEASRSHLSLTVRFDEDGQPVKTVLHDAIRDVKANFRQTQITPTPEVAQSLLDRLEGPEAPSAVFVTITVTASGERTHAEGRIRLDGEILAFRAEGSASDRGTTYWIGDREPVWWSEIPIIDRWFEQKWMDAATEAKFDTDVHEGFTARLFGESVILANIVESGEDESWENDEKEEK